MKAALFLPLITYIFLSLTASGFNVFSTLQSSVKPSRNQNNHLCLRMDKNENQSDIPLHPFNTRRRALSAILLTIMFSSKPVFANDELFKPNPLTNGILEKFRIWEQAEADDMKYDGTLAPGSGQQAYGKLLVPILIIAQDVESLDKLVHLSDAEGLDEANQILSKSQFEKKNFKKIFNYFADNIYYSDPDRANLYLGGGATPKNEQSIAYLLRNEILTNIENLQAEVAYLRKEQKAGNELEVDDLYLYSKLVKDNMGKYLELVPPAEIKIAKQMMSVS